MMDYNPQGLREKFLATHCITKPPYARLATSRRLVDSRAKLALRNTPCMSDDAKETIEQSCCWRDLDVM